MKAKSLKDMLKLVVSPSSSDESSKTQGSKRRKAGKSERWCRTHQSYYNAAFFKECPECMSEEGPFHRGSD